MINKEDKRMCNKCGFFNEKPIEIGGIGMCRVCGAELYAKIKKKYPECFFKKMSI